MKATINGLMKWLSNNKKRARKKSQLTGNIFIYLFSLIVIVLILIMGYKYISGTKDTMAKTELALLKNNLISDIKEISSDYGFSKKVSYSLPDSAELCLFDLSKKDIIITTLPESFNPLIKDSIQSNIEKNAFVAGSSVFESYNIGEIEINDPYFKCFKPVAGKISFVIEGVGNGAFIYEIGTNPSTITTTTTPTNPTSPPPITEDISPCLTSINGHSDVSINKIKLYAFYLVPKDRTPISDWNERIETLLKRIKDFHESEFRGYSSLDYEIYPTPVIGKSTSQAYRDSGSDIYGAMCGEVLFLKPRSASYFSSYLVFADWGEKDNFGNACNDYFVNRCRNNKDISNIKQCGGSVGTYWGDFYSDGYLGCGLVSEEGWKHPEVDGTDAVIYH